MILQPPSPVSPPVSAVTALNVSRVTIDLIGHWLHVTYDFGTPGTARTLSEPLGAAVRTAIEARCQALIEADLGITPGTSTITAQ